MNKDKKKKKLDPITAEIIQNTLVSVCDEMFFAVKKTANKNNNNNK